MGGLSREESHEANGYKSGEHTLDLEVVYVRDGSATTFWETVR